MVKGLVKSCMSLIVVRTRKKKKNRETRIEFLCWLVESSIQFSNTFIEDLLKVYEFAEKNSPYL